MSDLIKQPNGKYCRIGFSGNLLFLNYTEDDIVEEYVEEAKRRAMEDVKEAKHYGKIIENMERIDSRDGTRLIHDSALEKMGFEKKYEELVKFIPREPNEKTYIGNAFTTYGKCPTCGANVQNCFDPQIGKCQNCNQVLDWGK